MTIAPFAIVGPALSPLLDRGRQARRTSVAVANVGSALVCVGMARNLHDLLLFPEAFVVLVLGKLYLVARASLVPEIVGDDEDLATVNARLAVLASLSSLLLFPIGVGLLKLGAVWVLRGAALIFIAGGIASLRLPKPATQEGASLDETGERVSRPMRPMRLREVDEARRSLGLPLYRGEVRAAAGALDDRPSVGRVRRVLPRVRAPPRARRDLVVRVAARLPSAIGSLVGSLVVPRMRRFFSEQQIISIALGSLVVGSLAAGLLGGLLAQVMLTLVVGIAPTSAKPALDSIVQRQRRAGPVGEGLWPHRDPLAARLGRRGPVGNVDPVCVLASATISSRPSRCLRCCPTSSCRGARGGAERGSRAHHSASCCGGRAPERSSRAARAARAGAEP